MSVAGDAPTSAAAGAQPKRRPKLHRTSIGALALSASSALRLGLQFAILPILARLIGPAEYGLVAMAMPFVLLTTVLSDGGMTFALGRRQSVTRELESTVVWLSTGLGAAIALGLALLAWPLGMVMHQPRLPLLIVALSPILLINGALSASNARIIREGRFGVFAGSDLASASTAAAVAVWAAAHGFGAWSLIAQQLTLWVVKLAWVGSKGRVATQLCFRWQEAKELVKFGVHTVASQLADYVSRNVDNLIVGAVLGASQLGYYAMAYQLVRIPDMLISGPLYLYIFTAVSRAAHQPRKDALEQLAVSCVRLTATGFAPLFCGLAIIADLAVPLILGEKWQGAIHPLEFLAGAGFFFCMCALIGATFLARGRSALQLKLSLVMGGTTVLVVAATAPFGVTVVSAGLAVAMGLVCGFYLHQLAADLKMRRATLLAAFGPAIYGVAAMGAVLLPVKRLLAGAPPLAAMAVLIALGALVYGAVVALVARKRLVADARAFSRANADKSSEAALGAASQAV